MPAQNQTVPVLTTTMDIMNITSTVNITMSIMSMAAPAGTLTTAVAAVMTTEQNTLAKNW